MTLCDRCLHRMEKLTGKCIQLVKMRDGEFAIPIMGEPKTCVNFKKNNDDKD